MLHEHDVMPHGVPSKGNKLSSFERASMIENMDENIGRVVKMLKDTGKTREDGYLRPELPLAEWKDTYDTLHRWTQIIGNLHSLLQ